MTELLDIVGIKLPDGDPCNWDDLSDHRVYCISNGNSSPAIKIGMTSNLPQRLSQYASYGHIALLADIGLEERNDARACELSLHDWMRSFCNHNVRDWYAPPVWLQKLIAEVPAVLQGTQYLNKVFMKIAECRESIPHDIGGCILDFGDTICESCGVPIALFIKGKMQEEFDCPFCNQTRFSFVVAQYKKDIK